MGSNGQQMSQLGRAIHCRGMWDALIRIDRPSVDYWSVDVRGLAIQNAGIVCRKQKQKQAPRSGVQLEAPIKTTFRTVPTRHSVMLSNSNTQEQSHNGK